MPQGDWKNGSDGLRFACSWSGGKDSCLALWRAMSKGVPVKLFTMFDETGGRSRSHALSPEFVRMQASAVGLPHDYRCAGWGDYEAVFISALKGMKQEGVEAAVFGDIDLEQHGRWEEAVCREAGLAVSLPLWREDRRALAEEFIGLGFRAVIVTVNESMLDPKYLGREYTLELLRELEGEGVDLCGENGEFHTAVLDGPVFRHRVCVTRGEALRHGGYRFLPLSI